MKLERTGRPAVPFDDRVDRSGGLFGCWIWTGPTNAKGYGVVWFEGRARRAHQVAWIRANGPIADGQVICHTCDVRPCCNPSHLFAATQVENIADMDQKGRGHRIAPTLRATGDRHWTRRHPELVLRGQRNGNAKLTDSQVIEIRARAAGGTSHRHLGADYGVSPTRIRQIVSVARCV